MIREKLLAFLAGVAAALMVLSSGCAPCRAARVQWDDTAPIYTMQTLVPPELDPVGETAVPMLNWSSDDKAHGSRTTRAGKP